MRKFGLLAAAAGLVIGASVARADFVITDTVTPSTSTSGGKTFDTISYFVTNNGANGTGTQTNNIDVAVFDSTGGGKNGMLISGSNTADGSSGNAGSVGYPDLFGNNGETSLPLTSHLLGINTKVSQPTGGTSVVTFPTPGAFTEDQADGGGNFAHTYADLSEVGGFGAVQAWLSGAPTITSPTLFLQVSVEHGDSVTLVAPTSAGRLSPNATWETGGTAFGINGTKIIVPGVNGQNGLPMSGANSLVVATPEPASLGFLGLAAGGLLARRRRQA